MNPTLHALSPKEFSAETTTDHILIRVTAYVQQCWPKKCQDDVFRSFFSVRNELTVVSGYLYRGDRAIIPSSLRQRVLDLAHEGHTGIVKTKHRVRDSAWD